jgi:DNA-binding Lrp family transcriptional regulator
MRKELPRRLVRELLKNSKRSDRELAKILGVSQPTVTRTRNRLEENGMIEGYTITPNFREMGFEILAFTFVKFDPKFGTPDMIAKAKQYAEEVPNAILSSLGQGLGMNGVVVSLHRSYTEYQRQMNRLRADWGALLDNIQSFLIPLGEEFKNFSLTYLGDYPLDADASK